MADMRQLMAKLTPAQREHVSRLSPECRQTYLIQVRNSKKKEKSKNQIARKKKKELSASGNADFLDIMSDPFLLRVFYWFLESQFCPETLVGYLRLIYYEEHYPTWTKAKRMEEALFMVKEFFLPTSPNEVNVSDFLRSGISAIVTKEAEKEDPNIAQTVFNPAKQELINLLKLGKFTDFHKTDEYKKAKAGRDKFISFSAHNYIPNESISNSEWNILMTGGQMVTISPGEYMLKQNHMNQFFYRLESGTVIIEKDIDGKSTPVAELSTPDTMLGEISIFNSQPSSASVLAKTTVTLKRLQADLILFLFCTIPGGPQIGRKFFTSLGSKLSLLLTQITALEDVSISSTRVSFSDVIRDRRKDEEEVEDDDDATSQFHSRFNLEEDEAVILSGPCQFLVKPKRKATFYISSKHICIYASLLGHKTRETIPFADLDSISIPKPTDLYLHVGESGFLLRFPNSETLSNYLNLIKSITSASRKEDIPVSEGESPRKSDFDLPKTQEEVREFIALTEKEWLLLAGVNLTNSKKVEHNYNAVYFPGDAITREGISSHHRIYRLVSGTCDIRKAVPNPSPSEPHYITVGTGKPGSCFGGINFFLPSKSTTSIIATSICNVQVIDSYFLKTIYAKHSILILKLFYHICADIARLIIKRENEGWSRFERMTKKGETGQKIIDPADNSFSSIQTRRVQQSHVEETMIWVRGGESTELEVKARLDGAFLYLFSAENKKKPFLVLDLFSYAMKPEVTSFSLCKETEIHVFHPTCSPVDIWTHRIRQAALTSQNEFLRGVPGEFLESAKKYSKHVLGAEADAAVNGGRYIPCTVILRMEFICIYLWKMKAPAYRLNIMFGSVSEEGETSVLICSDDVATIKFESKSQRDEWIRKIKTVKQTFYFGGLSAEQARRLESVQS